MNIVITTGCPDSGWEVVLPILQQSGLKPTELTVNVWLNECYQAAGAGDLTQVRRPIEPEAGLGGKVAALFSTSASSSILFADSRNIWLLDFWARQFPQARFLLFFTSSKTALAHALRQEVELQKFLEQWQVANRQLLNFYRRHRQRSLMLDAEAVALHPQALEAVCRPIGLELRPVATFPAPAIPTAETRILAEYLLAAQPAVHVLQMELEASSPPLGDVGPKKELQLAELIDSFRQNQASHRKLLLELEQARQSLHERETAHREAAQKFEQVRAQQATVQQELTIQLEQTKQNLHKQENSQREMSQENELLLLQLHQVQEELEQYYLKWQELAVRKNAVVLPWSKATQTIAGWLNDRRKKRKIRRQVNLLRASGLFDEVWYLAAYPDVASADIDPIRHYLNHGAEEGRNPSPTFSTQAYLAANHDVVAAGMNPLVHFVKFGKSEGRMSHGLGSAAWQRKNKKNTVVLPWNNAAQAITCRLNNRRKKRKIRRQVNLLRSSGLFDEAWYLTAYPDVASAGIDPVKHYLSYGAAEGRDPSPAFDTRAYLAANPDIGDAAMNPLIHFVKFGRFEGRSPHKPGSAAWH